MVPLIKYLIQRKTVLESVERVLGVVNNLMVGGGAAGRVVVLSARLPSLLHALWPWALQQPSTLLTLFINTLITFTANYPTGYTFQL
jgi:hypothetical protein